MNKIRTCEICGKEGANKHISKYKGKLLCPKHRMQLWKYGVITDPTQSTFHNINKIVEKDNYALMLIDSKKFDKHVEVIIDKEDIDRIKIRKWNLSVQGKSINIFASIENKNIKLSRFLLNYDGPLFVDHINRNTLDNRKENLRIVTPAENSQNRTCIGVYATKSKKWKSVVTYYGITYRLGTFNTFEEAERARKNKIKELTENKTILMKQYYDLKPEKNILPINGKWKLKIKNKTLTFNTKEEAMETRDSLLSD